MADALERDARIAATDAFGGAVDVVARAPARVELLGNHTDHNGGLVLAAAIDRYTVVAGRAEEGRVGRVRSANLGASDVFGVDGLTPGEAGAWGEYVRGVTWAVGEASGGLNSGFAAGLAGDVPIGAGLSSSASLQAAFAMFLLAAGAVPGRIAAIDDDGRMELAKTLRRSENGFVGVASGLLDQFSSLFGRAGHALTLDCRSLEYERLPLGDPAPTIVVIDSATSRRLADGMYNVRRAECQSVVENVRRRKGTDRVDSLRDVTSDDLRDAWETLDPSARLRARHVLTENDRVRRGAEALKAGDVAGFGRLMSASHASSRDDFGNSSPALDALIEAAEASPGFLGGKLSGAGWAGCTVTLVDAASAAAFAASVVDRYARSTGLTPTVHVCRAADGASGRRTSP